MNALVIELKTGGLRSFKLRVPSALNLIGVLGTPTIENFNCFMKCCILHFEQHFFLPK
jgi:hypothetical protein